MTDRELMQAAIALAREAAADGEVPVGAVVAKDGEIVSVGRNRREKDKNALAHAEIGDRQSVQGARRLAALAMRAVCDARAVPDVRRGDNKLAHKARGVRGI